MKNTKEKLIIIGSGPAGLTAAIYAARSGLNPLLIEGNNPGGQLVNTSYVENWPGEKRILGVKLMQNMKDHAQTVGTRLIPGMVTHITSKTRPFGVSVEEKKTYHADALILAMGAVPKRLGCPGEDTYWGKGVTSCAVCDAAFYPDKQVIIVGGGDTAMEDASFLKKFTKKITIVHISDKLTASYAMQQPIINDPNITILYNSTVTEIQGENTHVTNAVITNQKTGAKTTLPADGIFIAIGFKPTTDIVKDHLELDDWGYIKVTNQTNTSVKGIFTAGDVHDYRYRQAITAAGSGCMAALDAERYLSLLKI